MAEADVVVKGRYVTDSSQGAPIEPRALLAQWQGDHVTVWSSTQVPYAARAGVAHVLQIPQSHVRVVVPLLGGGFGSKCDFHYEGHVAALARAAGRPVKLVFSREEEFVAPDHRREGMVIELETGARRDGTLVARRGRLVLDGGAYCGEGGFFAQIAAMHACGPYVIENVNVESTLVYTNNQPSGSIRAPTAPQVCWARRAAHGRARRGARHRPGRAAPAHARRGGLRRARRGRCSGRSAMKETLERAVEMIAPDGDLARGRGDRRLLRLVAVLREPLRRLREAERGRLGDDRHRRPGERQRRRDGAAAPRRRRARHGAVGLLDPLPGHGGRPVRRGLVRLADDDEQRARRRRGRRRGAREAARPRRGAARGGARGPRARRRAGPRRRRARRRPSRSPSSPAPGERLIGKGSGRVPETPAVRRARAASAGSAWSRSSSRRSSRTQLASRSTARRASSACCTSPRRTTPASIVNRIGASGQVYGGVVMGIGQALLEVSQLDEDGRQRNPHLLDYKLVTAVRRPAHRRRLDRDACAERGPEGDRRASASRPPCRRRAPSRTRSRAPSARGSRSCR